MLLQICLLPNRTEFRGGLEKISRKYDISIQYLYRRIEILGVFRIEARMGPRALQAWSRHIRAIVRLYEGNQRLMKAAIFREQQVKKELQAFLSTSYSDAAAAALLGMGRKRIFFFADILGALRRGENGKFTGAELKRFYEESVHYLNAVRFIQRNNKLRKN